MSAVDRELLDAAHKGDLEAVKAALAKGADWRYTVSGGVVRASIFHVGLVLTILRPGLSSLA